MFGKATIRLGIGPHSSYLCNWLWLRARRPNRKDVSLACCRIMSVWVSITKWRWQRLAIGSVTARQWACSGHQPNFAVHMCGGDTAFCQITLTTCLYYRRNLFNDDQENVRNRSSIIRPIFDSAVMILRFYRARRSCKCCLGALFVRLSYCLCLLFVSDTFEQNIWYDDMIPVF